MVFCLDLGDSRVNMENFPDGTVVNKLPANAGDMGLIPRLGRFPEEEMATHSIILA